MKLNTPERFFTVKKMPKARTTIQSMFVSIGSMVILAFAGTVEAQPFAYVANSGANSVSIINTATDTLGTTFSVGAGPRGLAVDNIGKRVYVANSTSNDVSVFDSISNTVIATIPVGANPRAVAINSAGTRVYVSSSNVNSVSVIDTMSNTVIATIPVGLAPRGVVVNPTGTRVFVANASSNNVSVIDATNNTAITTIGVGTNPFGVAINPTGTRVYVTNQNTNDVAVIDATNNTFLTGVIVGSVPQGIAVNPAGTRAYVTNASGNSVSVIDITNNTVVATVPVGSSPVGVAVNPAGTKIYVANGSTSNVSVIDGGSNLVISTLSAGISPGGIAMGPILSPLAPSLLSVTPGNGFASVAFSPPSNDGGSAITSYTVKSNPTNITVTGTSSPLLVSGLTNGTTYTFTVVANNVVGSSLPSAVSSPVVPAGPPAAPTITAVSPGNGLAGVLVTLNASNGSPITGYTVTSNPAGGIDTNAGTLVSGHTITGLTNGIAYTFTAVATNAIGSSVPSAPSISVIPATVPGTPIIGTAIVGDSQASVSFSPPTSNGGSPITSYQVTTNPFTFITAGTVSPILVTGLINGTTYSFTVKALNAAGAGLPSAVSNSVTAFGPPNTPGTVAATSGNGSATVTFSVPNANGSAITGYSVTTSPGGFITTGVASPITVMGLTNGIAYTFRVVATNAAGSGLPSAPSNSVIPGGVPAVPGSVVATPGNASATVAFAVPNANGSAITGYTVTSSPGGNIATGVASPITVSGLTNGQAYTFTVVAINANGPSLPSAPSNSVLPATVPVVLAQAPSILATGQSHSCAIANGGVQCWGANNSGQLGINSTTGRLVPAQVIGLSSGVTAVSAGNGYTCAVVNAGLQCWGFNGNGQLGNGSTAQSLVPVQVTGFSSGVTALSAGYSHACAVVNGGAQCWGFNASGRLGNNSTVDSLVPVQVFGLSSGVTAVSAANDHSCAIVNGGLQCWGRNANGELGNNSTLDSLVPVKVIGLGSGVTAVSLGNGFSCAVVNGGAQCWGFNGQGNLGNNSTTFSKVPLPVTGLGSGVTAISAGVDHSCAVVNAGLQCWGLNGSGQLGNNSFTSSLVPVPVTSAGSGITTTSAGQTHSCAVINGGVQCWGLNNNGQLGNGSIIQSLVPVAVAAVPGVPINVTAVAGNTQAIVSFTPPGSNGAAAITSYTVKSNPGNVLATGQTSPITVTGLANGTSYTFSVVANNAAGSSLPSAPSNSVTPTPAVSLFPAGINFGSRTVNTTSPPTRVTFTNNQTNSLTIGSIVGSGDFGFVSTCPISSSIVVAGGSCALDITFTPLNAGARNGDIRITSNAPGSPHFIQLSGVGIVVAFPEISISPSSLSFGPQIINTKSATQNITVTNVGFSNLILNSILVTPPFSRLALAGTNPADCGGSVAPGSSCQIGIAFEPTAIGAQVGQVSIVDNAEGSPHTVTLSATATPVPVPVIKVTSSVAFGDQVVNNASATQSITVGNTGAATLTLSAITLTGINADNFTLTGQSNCASIAPSGSCNLAASFFPTSVGTKTARINYSSNAENATSVNTTTLGGNGVLAPRPIANLTTTAIGFGNVIISGATPSKVVTLTNAGGQTMNIQLIDVTGDFVQANNCGSSLAPLASCAINVAFMPLASGAMFGELVVTSNATSSPDRIQLGGTGCRWFSQSKSRLFLTVCGG